MSSDWNASIVTIDLLVSNLCDRVHDVIQKSEKNLEMTQLVRALNEQVAGRVIEHVKDSVASKAIIRDLDGAIDSTQSIEKMIARSLDDASSILRFVHSVCSEYSGGVLESSFVPCRDALVTAFERIAEMRELLESVRRNQELLDDQVIVRRESIIYQ